MSHLKKILKKSRGTLGLHVALAMLLPAKGKAGADVKDNAESSNELPNPHAAKTAPPQLTGRWDFGRLFDVAAQPEIVKDVRESAETAAVVAKNAVRLAAQTAEANAKKIETPKVTTADLKAAETAASKSVDAAGAFAPKPMTHEEIRLWLQSFNAGPYALLKYQGDVPYKETQDYVPRVLKAYEQDLPDTYDAEVNQAAVKYGLDPQMIKAIMKTESDFRKETVSHAGARGLMQVMPVVWSDVEKKYNMGWDYSTEVFEPAKNIEVACAYLAWLRYDFLPRHFDAYEQDPAAPVVLVRDKDRGVPDRPTPRIIARAAGATAALEVAAAAESEVKKVEKVEVASADEKPKTSEKRVSRADVKEDTDAKADDASHREKPKVKAESQAAKPKVEITDADSDRIVKKSTSNGKTRVVVKPGKAISLSVSQTGKVSTEVSRAAKDNDELKKAKRPSVAKASTKEDKTQGG